LKNQLTVFLEKPRFLMIRDAIRVGGKRMYSASSMIGRPFLHLKNSSFSLEYTFLCLNLVIFTIFWLRMVASMPTGSEYCSESRKTSLKSYNESYISRYVCRSMLNHHASILVISKKALNSKIPLHSCQGDRVPLRHLTSFFFLLT
jgi:hypothetical protein